MVSVEKGNDVQDCEEFYSRESLESFDELGLKADLIKGIYDYDYEKPSSIQHKIIIPLIQGKNIIAQTQSSSEKTSAYIISTLELIDQLQFGVQALILASTRELAHSICGMCNGIGVHLDINVLKLPGEDDIKSLDDKAYILVGTPKAALGMLKKGSLMLDNLKILIIDEVDELLEKGFEEVLIETISRIPSQCQISFFTYTMPEEVVKFASNYGKNPVTVVIKKLEYDFLSVNHYYANLNKELKLDTLMSLYTELGTPQVIIYGNTKRTVINLAEVLKKRGHFNSCVHSDLSKEERNRELNHFKSGSTKALITTDIVGRRIDVSKYNLIINYDLPNMKESYLLRVGRPAHLGTKTNVINFILPDDKDNMEQICKLYEIVFEKLPQDLDKLIIET